MTPAPRQLMTKPIRPSGKPSWFCISGGSRTIGEKFNMPNMTMRQMPMT